MKSIQLKKQVPIEFAGERLDQVAVSLFPDFSRSRLQSWIKDGGLTIDGKLGKPKLKVFGGEQLEIVVELVEEESWKPQDIALDVVYEDEDILVINKPAGLVVHPAAGHVDDTLLNALVYRSPEQAALPRGGIVHRLDKDTSGIMVVAKSLPAHASLVDQLQCREMGREYEAVCLGVLTGGGEINEPIGRHPVNRKKMAVTAAGKPALTHYQIIQRFRAHTHIGVKLETGRTHQIRVHMSHIHHPLVGDPVYAGRARLPKGATEHLVQEIQAFPRQALFAKTLRLSHPRTDETMQWSVPRPDDIQRLLNALRQDQAASTGNQTS